MSRQLFYLRRRLFSSTLGLRLLDSLPNFELIGIPDQTRKDAFPLDRMKSLLWKLGDPQHHLRVIRVAGSSGKGSVASFLASMFSASDLKTGLCLSPHVSSVTERISCSTNGTDGTMAPISSNDLDRLISEHKMVLEETKATYFEALIALSFVHFARNNVKHAIVETGLGGVTDATNCLEDENIDATVICPIELEHRGLLGNDIREIVENETAIVRSRRPVVVAQQPNASIRNQILEICGSKKCILHEPDMLSVEHHSYRDWAGTLKERVNIRIPGNLVHHSGDLRFERVETRLVGRHQHENIKTAMTAALVAKEQGWALSEKAIKRGIRDTFLPGRIQFMRPHDGSEWFVLDGAHSIRGARALAVTLRDVFPDEGLVLVLCMSKEKEHEAVLDEMIQLRPDVVIFTAVQNLKRALPPGALLAHWEQCEMKYRKRVAYRCRKTVTANITTAILKARTELDGIDKTNAHTPGIICLSGSLYGVGEGINLVYPESNFVSHPII